MLAALSATEIILIMGAFGAMVVQVITALKTNATVKSSALETEKKVKETHDAVNSRMEKFLADQKVKTDELLKVAIEAAHAAGVKQATDTMKSVAAASPIAPATPSAPVPVVVIPDPDQPVPVTISESETKPKKPRPDA